MNIPVTRNMIRTPRGLFRCFSAPVNYFDSAAKTLRPIDQSYAATATLDGKSKLARERSPLRSYFDADGITFMPDCSSSEFFQISLESLKSDNQTVIPVKKSPILKNSLIDMGSIQALSTRNGHKLLIPGSGLDDFEIAFRIKLKNLTITEKSGEFHFHSTVDDAFRFRIAPPCILGPDLNPVQPEPHDPAPMVSARMEQDGDDLIYIKTPGPGFSSAKSALPPNYWIDANIIYSQASDGWLACQSDVSWAAACAGGATSSGNSNAYTYAFGGGSGINFWNCRRAYFMFDASGSGISGSSDIASASVNFCVRFWQLPCGDAHLNQGTFTSWSTSNWASFSDYLGSCSPTQKDVTNPDPGWISFSLDSTGINNINLSGVTSYVIRHSGDYSGSGPEAYVLLYFADNTGTDKDPYLEIVPARKTPNIIIV